MFIDKYLTYEQDKKLFQLEIDGFNYWHFIRKDIYDEMLADKNEIGEAHTNLSKESYYTRVFLKLKQMPNWILKNPLLGLKEKDLLILNHHRRVKNKEYFDCIYTDELLKKMNYTYYVFEQPMLEEHFSPIRTENIRYFDYLNFIIPTKIEMWKKLFRFDLDKNYQTQIECMLYDLDKHFKVSIDQRKMLKLIENLYLYYKFSRKYYAKILDKVKPKAIVELVSYVKDRYIINELAKERGIPIIEFQHGTMGKYHIAYNFEKKIEIASFPDYIFTFGQFWKESTRLPIEDDRVKVVGWPYFEQRVSECKKEKETKNNLKKTILFISQGTIGKELSKVATDFSKRIDNDKYRIIYKLHRGEYARWKNEYEWLIDANIEVVDNNNHDMHYYFANADIQVGVYSTALFEGLGYGLKTYIVKLYGHQCMEELYINGHAFLVNDAFSIINDIESAKVTNKNFDEKYFWKKNSMSNIRSEINKIIKMRDEI